MLKIDCMLYLEVDLLGQTCDFSKGFCLDFCPADYNLQEVDFLALPELEQEEILQDFINDDTSDFPTVISITVLEVTKEED